MSGAETFEDFRQRTERTAQRAREIGFCGLPFFIRKRGVRGENRDGFHGTDGVWLVAVSASE
jgi:hypothetical protein